MDASILTEIGLTNAEIKIFLALLELGTTTTGPILDKTGLPNSVVYATLPKLVQKGFVTFFKKGHARHYQATEPERIIDYFERKKQKLEELLPQLKAKQKKQERQEVEVFEGFRGFKMMIYKFIEEANKGDEYLFFGFDVKNPKDYREVYDFYEEFERERQRYGLIVKGILPKGVEDKFINRDRDAVVFVDFPVLSNISLLNNKIIMTPWEDKSISFLISSRQLAESFRQYFYSIWNQYKK